MRRRGSGTYVYPLPPSEWTTSRTDQGVDFVNKSAGSRILAIGRAKILKTGAPGWPGGGGVLYELLEGPRKGQVVYAYENVKPQVKPGQVVQPGQVIATMLGTGYPWLEMGFANRAGEPTSHPEYTEGKETRAGKAFKGFIAQLPKMGPHGGFAGNFGKAAERKAREESKSENLGEGLFPSPSEVGGTVLDEIFGAIHPEALMLNVALIGGGAFLVYYGAALMLGVRKPVATPARAVAP